MMDRTASCLLLLLLVSTTALADPLYTEDFNGIEGGGEGRQFQTSLPLRHSANLPGWTKSGLNCVHTVQYAEKAEGINRPLGQEQFRTNSHITGNVGNWALQLVGVEGDDNILTLDAPCIPNEEATTYTVGFDVGPSVWAAGGQATKSGLQIMIELLRTDDTVLASHSVTVKAWEGRQEFVCRSFTYQGDGSGQLRFRLSPVDSETTCLHGAIDNLQVFGSEVEARATFQQRRAAASAAQEALLEMERERAEQLARLSPLERDWLLQAGGDPTINHVRNEIAWACQLADRLSQTTEQLDFSRELQTLGELEAQLSGVSDDSNVLELYIDVRRVKRKIAFRNPAIDFSNILLVDCPYPGYQHESAHRHGYRTSGRGRLLVLEKLDPDGPVRSLVPEEQSGFFWRPDLSFDAQKVVFCMMPKDERSFHLYEVNIDGSDLTQLTFGDYDDLDPIYLPDGHLLFNTTRANTYVRCGPTHHSPVLARCDGDGKNIYVISRNCEPDYLSALLPDGRVIYTRWEYTDKEQKRAQSLWTMNPDGTGVAVLWGNQSVWPDMLVESRPIPGTGRIMFTGVGHHQWFNGSIGIIEPTEGMNYPDGLTKITPEVPWPEVGNGSSETPERVDYRRGVYPSYKTPYPISEEDFLVSIRHPQTEKYSLYLMDLQGNRELIYSGEENVWHAVPLRPHPMPPIIPDRVAWPDIGPDQGPLEDGILYSSNVFEGEPLLPRDEVKYLRVLQIDAKTYTPWRKTYQHSGPSISITQADGVKRILGTTPVEADGSVCFRVPPGRALHFQLLDENYRCVQTMRSFTGVMPGETRGCLGCHESRSPTPVNTSGGLAMRRGPLALTPPPWGIDESISYHRFVQPALDRYCGRCHQDNGKAREKLDLTFRPSDVGDPVYPDEPPQWTEPYVTLVGGGNNWYQPVEDSLINEHGLPVSISGCLIVEGYHERTPEALATLKPMSCMSSNSLLIDRAMDEEHIETVIDPETLRRLIAWVDANGPYLGEEEIRAIPDPTPETMWPEPVPVVRPRLMTAPKINRFNIRQDGESSMIYFDGEGIAP
jgi:hypothetical protein